MKSNKIKSDPEDDVSPTKRKKKQDDDQEVWKW